jgi:methyltransferase family protein
MTRMTIGVVFAAAFTISGAAQDVIAQSGVPAGAFPKPDRPVADIVSPIWHDEKERDDAGEPGQLVRLLGIKSGMAVADIGAGSGYYVVRLSPIVGSKGRIIAEDIVPKYLQSLRTRVRKLGLQNVVISLGEPHDPKLPADSVDIAILVCITRSSSLTPCSTISSPRSGRKRASALSTPSHRRPSTVPRQICCAASSRPSGIARSVSTG